MTWQLLPLLLTCGCAASQCGAAQHEASAMCGSFYLACVAFTVLVVLRWLWLILEAAWTRRWQLLDGGDKYMTLPPSYGADALGVVPITEEDDGVIVERNVSVHGHRWALVTGGSRGIGRAFVSCLADMGFSLIIVDLDDSELAATANAAQLRLERGWRGGVWAFTREVPKVISVGCDVTSIDSAVQKCEEAVASLPRGSLRLLVNNVGVSTHSPALLTAHTAADVERLVRINALFGMQLTRALWPRLIEAPTPPQVVGSPSRAAEGEASAAGTSSARTPSTRELAQRRTGLLFVSSAASQIPAAHASVYAATKGAVNTFARAVRAEATALDLSLDVLAVTPGYVRAGNTPRWAGHEQRPAPSATGRPGLSEPQAAGATPKIQQPIAGFAEPEDVARASLLLLPTARAPVMTPLITDALSDFIVRMLPEATLSRLVHQRLDSQRLAVAAQRQEQHAKDE